MLGDIYTGIFNFNGSSLVTPSCPTGDCAWNSSSIQPVTSYASLGVCGKCQDSTASLQKSCGTCSAPTAEYITRTEGDIAVGNDVVNITSPYCNYTLPNGLSLAGNNVFPTIPYLNSSGVITNNTQFQHLATPFTIFSMIRAGWTTRFENGTEIDNAFDGVPAASYLKNATSLECALYPCVRLYNATVVNGTFKEHIIETYQNETATTGSMSDDSNSWYNLTLTIPDTWRLVDKAPRIFTVAGMGWQGIHAQFQKLWNANVTTDSTSPLSEGHTYCSSDVAQTIFGLNDTGLRKTVDNLAQSMTTNVRQSGSQSAEGIAYQSIPYVSVQWGWITLPALLLIIAFILLASTIFRTKRKGTQLWKGSSLAAFYHPLTGDGREKVGGARNNRQLEKIAEDIKVKWTKTDKGWRLIPVEGAEECRKVV
jgi:hypothetical protein